MHRYRLIDSDQKQTQGRGAQSHPEGSQSMLRYMHPHHLNMTLFCKQKEFNSEIIFVLISDYDFGYYIVNGQKYHFWLNAYFVKELH